VRKRAKDYNMNSAQTAGAKINILPATTKKGDKFYEGAAAA
jgi:hypothetical protein